MRRSISIAAGALATVGGLMALTPSSNAAPPDKVTICHGTASESNPYVEVTVSAASFKDGHFDDGPENKSHGDQNHPDFVLEEGRSCDDGPGGGTDGSSDGGYEDGGTDGGSDAGTDGSTDGGGTSGGFG
jgi:hypothetical protein